MLNKIYYFFNRIFKFPFPIFLKKKFKRYYALNDLDKKLEKYINYNNGYYVELGSFDGITQSNTFYYEKNKNWKGLLIEPIKHKFDICKKNRSKKNKFYNGACVSFKYKEKKIKLIYSNLKSFAPSLVEYRKYNKQLNKPELLLGEKNFSFESNVSTLSNLFKKYKSPKKMDLLSLDTEGAEFEVLKGIDYKKYSFRYLLIETSKFKKLKTFLSHKNYMFVKKLSNHDYLFKYNNKL